MIQTDNLYLFYFRCDIRLNLPLYGDGTVGCSRPMQTFTYSVLTQTITKIKRNGFHQVIANCITYHW